MKLNITVLSNDIDKSKEFARFIMNSEEIESITETKDELKLVSNPIKCTAMKVGNLSRGLRHNKFYIDSKTTITDEQLNTLILAKILPVFLSKSLYSLKISNPVEYVDFDKFIIK